MGDCCMLVMEYQFDTVLRLVLIEESWIAIFPLETVVREAEESWITWESL